MRNNSTTTGTIKEVENFVAEQQLFVLPAMESETVELEGIGCKKKYRAGRGRTNLFRAEIEDP